MLSAATFDASMLQPRNSQDLLNANGAAQATIRDFFLQFQRFNEEHARSPNTALLPKSTCLIVKGPPGCGKTEAVEFYMRQAGIEPTYRYSMALESRNSDFMSLKFNDALHNTPIGSAVLLKDVDTLSTNGKQSPSKKLAAFLDSPGMALSSRGARALRDRESPETAASVAAIAERIRSRYTRDRRRDARLSSASTGKTTTVTRDYELEAKQSNRSGAGDRTKKRSLALAFANEQSAGATDIADAAVGGSASRKSIASVEKTRFARNTKACVPRKNGREPANFDELYRKYYDFTTHVPLILIANDHQHHMLFTEFKKLQHCTLVQFRQPSMAAISTRIAQIFMQHNIQAPKPKDNAERFLVSEIAASASGDMRKAMRIVSIGIQRSLRFAEMRAELTNEPRKPYLAFKRRFISALFDRQLSAQNDHFTAVSFLALDCPDLATALQHVARPRLAMVPHTVYESFFRLLPYAPASEAFSNRQRRLQSQASSHASITPRSTKNSNKDFSLDRLKQKLFVQMRQNLTAIKYGDVEQSQIDRVAALGDNEFCENLINQFISQCDQDRGEETATTPDETSGVSANTLNRAAESVCRADFEEVFSCADMVTQEFCCRRSPQLQQTWHDSAVAWAFMLRKAGDRFPTYGFQPQCSYDRVDAAIGGASANEEPIIGFVQTRPICSGRNSKNTGPCIRNANTCTCRWLTTPSLKGSRGVRLQWFKSSVVERDLYDIKTRAICQSSCDRFFFYTNYISCMQQVRKRGQMLVNLQDKSSKVRRKK